MRSASQSTPNQLLDDPAVVPALERYGAFAKAAYIMFENATQHDTVINGRKLSDIAVSDEPGLEVLAGYKGVSVISGLTAGFPGGNLFESANPDAAKMHKVQPTFLGFIAEGTGADGTPELVVAFRGRAGRLGDWIGQLFGGTDAKPYRTEPGSSKGRVHGGFLSPLRIETGGVAPMKAIENVVAASIAANKAPPRIVTTGHSLGGALAILAAATIAVKHTEYQQPNDDYTQRLLQTYTFAAPRVGDQQLHDYFADTLHYRAVQMKNKQDVVPYVAPSSWDELPATLTKALDVIGSPKPKRAAGASGAPPAEEAAGFWESYQQDRLLTYQKLAATFASTQELAAACDDPDALMATLGLQPSGAVNPLLGVRDDVEELLEHANGLLKLLSTSWADNPAGPDYVFDGDEAGKWGGDKHSQEVYLSHIKDFKP